MYHMLKHVKVFFPSFTESVTDRSIQAFTDWVQTMQQEYMSGAKKQKKTKRHEDVCPER